MKSPLPSYSFLALALAFTGTTSFGASFALDDASDLAYDFGWSSGQNGGSGFQPWELTQGPTNSGFFTGSSSDNGNSPSGDIDVTGESWGLYANGGETASAVRRFSVG